MLDTTNFFELPEPRLPPVPDQITGRFLARNRLSPEARVALALHLLRGNEPITGFTVAQVSRLVGVPRVKIDRHLARHRNVGDAMVSR